MMRSRRLGALLVSLGVLGCDSCACDDDDDSIAEALAYDCEMELDTDHDDLVGCADPDCREQPQCQVTWVSDVDAVFGSVIIEPEDTTFEGGQTISSVMAISPPGGWVDLDGDGESDTVVVESCYSFNAGEPYPCTASSAWQVGTYLLSGARLAEERHLTLTPEEAMSFGYVEPDAELFDSNFTSGGTTSILDLDGDGHEDLLVAQPYPGAIPTLQLWWGREDGLSLPTDPDLVLEDRYSFASTYVAGDLDGDGTQDVAFLGGPVAPGSIGLLLGGERPPGLDSAHHDTRIDVGATTPGYTFLVENAGDLVGDTRDDLLMLMYCGIGLFPDVTSDLCEGGADVLVVVFAGRETWPGTLELGDADVLFAFKLDDWSLVQGRPADTGDVDGDGRVDLVYATEGGAQAWVTDDVRQRVGLAVVYPGMADGWSPDALPEPRYLFPASDKSEQGNSKSFGCSVLVQDIDGDGIDDVVVGDGETPAYAQIAEHFDRPYGEDCEIKILYHVFRGGPSLVGDPSSWAFPDHLVVTGEYELTSFTTFYGDEALLTETTNATMALVPDLDGDGSDDWVNHSMEWWSWHVTGEFYPSETTLIDIFSGAELFRGFIESP